MSAEPTKPERPEQKHATVDPAVNEPGQDSKLFDLLADLLTRMKLSSAVDRPCPPAPQPQVMAEGTPPGPPPKMIGAAEAARLCGISRTAWYNLKAGGRLPAPVRLGRRVLWRVDELEAWMDANCPPRHQWQWSGDKVTTKRGTKR